jgi:hypothetical protein
MLPLQVIGDLAGYEFLFKSFEMEVACVSEEL